MTEKEIKCNIKHLLDMKEEEVKQDAEMDFPMHKLVGGTTRKGTAPAYKGCEFCE